MAETRLADELTAAEVARYLGAHPAFLKDYPGLALRLELPRGDGQVTSLASYQLEVLRRRNRELESKLDELLQAASGNEQLALKVHAFNISLLGTGDFNALLRAVVAGLSGDFDVDVVRMLLFVPSSLTIADDAVRVEAGGPEAVPALGGILASTEPQVGRLPASVLDSLFGDLANTIQSAAVVRLGTVGILAMGSHDASHFHPGTGGVFLKLIGETVAAALGRHAHGE